MNQTWIDDELGRKEESEFLTKLLENRFKLSKDNSTFESFVLNINAEWGFGKTYFLENWAEDLKNEDFLVIYFDAWHSDFSDEPLLAFISEINDKLSSFISRSRNAKKLLDKTISSAKKLIKPSVPLLLSLLAKQLIGLSAVQLKEYIDEFNLDVDQSQKDAASSVASAIVEKAAEQALINHETTKKSIENFRNNVLELLDYIDKNLKRKLPLFIFVDELDRCRPSYSIELLETIKHLFGLRGVYFIVATDSRQLSASIKSVYGNDFDAERYLKRFFDQEFALAEPDNRRFANYLFKKYSLDEAENIFSPLIQRFHGNGNICIEIFSLYASYFDLSLRDQDQVCLILNSIRLAYIDEPIHLGLILFLIMLRQRNPKSFDGFQRNNIAQYKGRPGQDFIEKLDFLDTNVKYKTARYNNGRSFDQKCDLSRIFFFYFAIVDQDIESIGRSQYDDECFRNIQLKICYPQSQSQSQASGARAKGHNLNSYINLVRQAGRFS